MEDKMEDIGMRKENNSCILKEIAADEMGVGVIELKSIFLYTKSNSFKNA